jgi:hypothetical protein
VAAQVVSTWRITGIRVTRPGDGVSPFACNESDISGYRQRSGYQPEPLSGTRSQLPFIGYSVVIVRISLFLFFCATAIHANEIQLTGRVLDDNSAPVPDAAITVGGAGTARSGATGAFAVTLPAPGDYSVTVEREGFYKLTGQTVHAEAGTDVTLVLSPVHEVFQTVNVHDQPSPVDLAQTENEQRLSGTEINDIPYPSSHSLLNAMSLMPGVIQDSGGTPHFNGASADQVLYVLNGFNITDPATGVFETRVGLEGVRSMQYLSGRYSPEYGKGSAGVLAIRTDNGTNEFRFTATDFIPGIDTHEGVHLGDWYPRFGVSGPIVKGRAWFADNIDGEYDESVVAGLPSGQNTSSGWTGSNLLHTQANLTSSNMLFADFLVTLNNQNRAGLGPLDPVSTTTSTRARQYFVSLRDQIYLGAGVLLELGYAHNEFTNRQTPQGKELYVIAPSGRGGDYFVRSGQTSWRDEGIANLYFSDIHFAGTHQIRTGGDADRLGYTASFNRTGYEVIGLSGQLLSATAFQGAAPFHVPDTEAAWYVLDSWRLSQRLQVNAGIRGDWDAQIQDFAWSPHASVSWAPFGSGRTRVVAGYAITHDAVTLGLLGRPLDQTAMTTSYNPDGTPAGPPVPTVFRIGPSLVLPEASNWSASVDHRFTGHLRASAGYLRRHGADGFTFLNTLDPNAPPSELPVPNAVAGGLYELTNLRRDDYQQESVSIRQTYSGQYEWMLSYVHSRALSNALLDVYNSQPLQLTPAMEPVPWDAPNRVVGSAYLPLPFRNWAIAALADAHSGFPFSAVDQTGVIAGGVDSRRYPFNFELNIHIERTFTLAGYRFALRGGVNNITNQANPTAVNNVIGAPQYLMFFGDEGRHFVLRVRFFGRAVTK